MSSINRLESSSIQQILQQRAVSSSSGKTGTSPADGLDAALQSAGLSDANRASLKDDLQSALSDVFSSGTFPPDPEAVESTVKQVFEKYGLNADEFKPKGQPPVGGPPPGGGVGQSDATGSDSDAVTELLLQLTQHSTESSAAYQSDDAQSLLDTLNSFLSSLQEDNASQDTADFLLTALVGFDKSA